MTKGVDYRLMQFAEGVRDMKWTHMNGLSNNIASCINDMIDNKEVIDGPYIADLLNSFSEDIFREDKEMKDATP